MEKIAPYANTPIPLSLGSVTGLKYKTLSCIECGRPLFERNGSDMYRIGSSDWPERAHVGADGTISASCSKCTQKYTVTLSQSVQASKSNIPLYMQPQSLFIAAEPTKKLRDMYCMECGKAFYSISDRVKLLSDNTIPFEVLDPEKLGPMEVWCKFNHCKQRWAVMP